MRILGASPACVLMSVLVSGSLARAEQPPAKPSPAEAPPAAPSPGGAAPGAQATEEGEADDDGPSLDQLGIHPVDGPRKIPLGKELTLDLPADYFFLDAASARKFAELNHNVADDRLLGTVLQKGADWFVEITFDEEGYVKDDEADDLDKDAILKSFQEGTEQDNKRRTAQGFAAIRIEGWAEPPRYVRAHHQVVWALSVIGEEGGKTVNYNTRVLGRRGYASLNLVGPLEQLAASKPGLEKLLAATTFDPGARYEDFSQKTDKVAEYGLAALVAGGAGAMLVKAGFFAKFGALFLKILVAGGKGIVILLLGAFAALRRLFGGKKAEVAPPAATASAAPPAPTSAAAEGEVAPAPAEPPGAPSSPGDEGAPT